MALIQCPDCGKDISNKAPACIHCGYPVNDSNEVPEASFSAPPPIVEKQKLGTAGKYGIALPILLVTIFLLVNHFSNTSQQSSNTASISTPSEQPGESQNFSGNDGDKPPIKAAISSSQEEFAAARAGFYARYKSAPNEIQKSAIFNEANKWTANFAKKQRYKIVDWHGTIADLNTSHGGGSVFLTLKDNSGGIAIEFHTRQTETLDDEGSVIKPSSTVYTQLSSLKEGDNVIFSGTFIPDEEKGAKETSISEQGSLEEPAFLIKFKEIHKAGF